MANTKIRQLKIKGTTYDIALPNNQLDDLVVLGNVTRSNDTSVNYGIDSTILSSGDVELDGSITKSIAGIMGYHWLSGTSEGNNIYFFDLGEEVDGSVISDKPLYEVGDILSFTGYNSSGSEQVFDNYATVTQVNNGGIYVQISNSTMSLSYLYDSEGNHKYPVRCSSYAVWCTAKPGNGIVPISDAVFVTGKSNKAFGNTSFTTGSHNTSSAQLAFTEGYGNINSGVGGHAEGGENILAAKYGHVEGYTNQVYGANAHAQGRGNKVYSQNGHVGGYTNTISTNGTNSSIVAGRSNTIETQNSAVLTGYNNKILGSAHYNSILSGQNNIIEASAKNSTVLAGSLNKIQGSSEDSAVIGSENILNTTVKQSLVVGLKNNTVGTSTACLVVGKGHTLGNTSGYALCVGNTNNVLNKFSCAALGDNLIVGRNMQTVLGSYNVTNSEASLIIGNGYKDTSTNVVYRSNLLTVSDKLLSYAGENVSFNALAATDITANGFYSTDVTINGDGINIYGGDTILNSGIKTNSIEATTIKADTLITSGENITINSNIKTNHIETTTIDVDNLTASVGLGVNQGNGTPLSISERTMHADNPSGFSISSAGPLGLKDMKISNTEIYFGDDASNEVRIFLNGEGQEYFDDSGILATGGIVFTGCGAADGVNIGADDCNVRINNVVPGPRLYKHDIYIKYYMDNSGSLYDQWDAYLSVMSQYPNGIITSGTGSSEYRNIAVLDTLVGNLNAGHIFLATGFEYTSNEIQTSRHVVRFVVDGGYGVQFSDGYISRINTNVEYFLHIEDRVYPDN